MTPTQLVTCSPQCASGLRCDNEHGAIYGPYYIGSTRYAKGRYVNRLEWAAYSGECIYDRAPLPRGRAALILRRLKR